MCLVQALPECQIDNDCSDHEICSFGNCEHACIKKKCGAFAKCDAQFHRATCMCLEDHTGNPDTACYPSKTIK